MKKIKKTTLIIHRHTNHAQYRIVYGKQNLLFELYILYDVRTYFLFTCGLISQMRYEVVARLVLSLENCNLNVSALSVGVTQTLKDIVVYSNFMKSSRIPIIRIKCIVDYGRPIFAINLLRIIIKPGVFSIIDSKANQTIFKF